MWTSNRFVSRIKRRDEDGHAAKTKTDHGKTFVPWRSFCKQVTQAKTADFTTWQLSSAHRMCPTPLWIIQCDEQSDVCILLFRFFCAVFFNAYWTHNERKRIRLYRTQLLSYIRTKRKKVLVQVLVQSVQGMHCRLTSIYKLNYRI